MTVPNVYNPSEFQIASQTKHHVDDPDENKVFVFSSI